jgi:hypothetical protein
MLRPRNYNFIKGNIDLVDRYHLYPNMRFLNLKNKATFLYVYRILATDQNGDTAYYTYFERSFALQSWKKGEGIELYISPNEMQYNIKNITSGEPFFCRENSRIPLTDENGFVIDWPIEGHRAYKHRYEVFLHIIIGVISLVIMAIFILIIPLAAISILISKHL